MLVVRTDAGARIRGLRLPAVWRILWRAEALILAVLLGCSTARPVSRMDTGADGETLIYIPRAATVEPAGVAPEQVTEAIRKLAREVRLTGSPRQTVERLFQLDALHGDYLYLLRERKILPLEPSGMPLEGALTQEAQNLVSRYRAWCRSAQGVEGDCLGGALVGGKYLDMQGRYMLAMALSKSPVLEEFEKALGEKVSMRAVLQAALGTVVTLLVVLALPEPITKFVAAWATAALVLWVGASTLYNLVTGWFQLMEEVKTATTFDEIREAGEKFGQLFSREAAQAFALIAMALLTHTEKGFAEQVARLPGSAHVSMQAARSEGILLSEVGAVESVAVTAEGFSVALAAGTVAMAVRGARADRTEKHHIATIANMKSSLRGGPWTPLFEELFARAGMRLKDRHNVVPIRGHKGPHPRRYHQLVLESLQSALGGCRSIAECRARLLPALDDLAKQISTPGTELNRLVTLEK
ncbi:A nuclease family of the HNH/ENDO VII superfamily with conserved AHH [Stigmatella aurantiaca]|uniref:A nuclease family of the HNH/ENDO VII superfamily with conserved AHH n=2 Tax=Stigmatella aurantiaca TaxID=41 RepID=A0A1H7WU16_STIAU|nr:A nuclease family of the HNH/ENDO VII superfamily with conserved AHH [Stigmatella aurantiaca]